MEDANREMMPHTALRIIERKLYDLKPYISGTHEVWLALDRLWDLVIKGE